MGGEALQAAVSYLRRLRRFQTLQQESFQYFLNAATGESATFFPAEFSGAKCMDIWSQESLRYDYELPGWQQGTNYFTQA